MKGIRTNTSIYTTRGKLWNHSTHKVARSRHLVTICSKTAVADTAHADAASTSLKKGGNHKGDVVIVGAGPAGSLAAMYLAKRGYKVQVFEKRPDPSVHTWNLSRTFPMSLTPRQVQATLVS